VLGGTLDVALHLHRACYYYYLRGLKWHCHNNCLRGEHFTKIQSRGYGAVKRSVRTLVNSVCACGIQLRSVGDRPCYAVAVLRENAVRKLKNMIRPTDRHDDLFWQSAFGNERIANHVQCTIHRSLCLPVF